MRKPKLIIGISLVVQSITMFFLFLSFLNKNKKQLAGTFLTVGIVGGLVGLWMLYLEYLENDHRRHTDKLDAGYEKDDECDCCQEDGFEDVEESDDEVNYSIQEDDQAEEEKEVSEEQQSEAPEQQSEEPKEETDGQESTDQEQ